MGSIPPETVKTIKSVGKYGGAGLGGTGVLGLLLWMAMDMREQTVQTRNALTSNVETTSALSANVEKLTGAVNGLDKTITQVQTTQAEIRRRGDEFRGDIEKLKERAHVHPYQRHREDPDR